MIKKAPNQNEAKIFSDGKEIAGIRKGKISKLVSYKDGLEWSLTNRVHGEMRPFSFSVSKIENMETGNRQSHISGEEIFVVRDQLFEHNGKFYMLANHPAGKSWDHHVDSNVRYIGRLDDFPYSSHSEVDYEHQDLREKVKTLRGVHVGEASGSGLEEHGHLVRLDDELADVGLFIAAISYLLYTSA